MSESGKFQKVAVLKGGVSGERDVSLRSGSAVSKGLRDAGYEVVEIDVVERNLSLPGDVEAVFVALHGEFGEDGEVQDALEESHVPYTGSGPEASRKAFDKIVSKEIFVKSGVPTPAYEVLEGGGARNMALPVVVKPARQGSSIGIHRVVSESAWADSVADALSYDGRIIVEEYIAGRELTVGIVDGLALPVLEIVAPDNWYDYGAKYTAGRTCYRVPAPIDDGIAEECRMTALRVFNLLGCEGLARVDFRLSDRGAIYALELNSIPGFTETSLLPKAAAAAGMDFVLLCDRIMRSASCGS